MHVSEAFQVMRAKLETATAIPVNTLGNMFATLDRDSCMQLSTQRLGFNISPARQPPVTYTLDAHAAEQLFTQATDQACNERASEAPVKQHEEQG